MKQLQSQFFNFS